MITMHSIGTFQVFMPARPDRRAWMTNPQADLLETCMVVPNNWEECFSRQQNFRERQTIFIGAKGVGKSSLLHLKRMILEGKVHGVDVPKNVICLPREWLASQPVQHISVREPRRTVLTTLSNWVSIWCLLIGAICIQFEFDKRRKGSVIGTKDGAALAEDDNALVQSMARVRAALNCNDAKLKESCLFDYLDHLMQGELDGAALNGLYRDHVKPYLSTMFSATKICFFLDAIDQKIKDDLGTLAEVGSAWLGSLVGDPSERDRESYSIWSNAQLGVVEAADQLWNDSTRSIKLYSSIRSEALQVGQGTQAVVQYNQCRPVTYNHEKLRAIVRLNMYVDMDAKGELAHKGDAERIDSQLLTNVERQFFSPADCGWKPLGGTHRTWVDEMIRLSMERPRELMWMGEGIRRGNSSSFDNDGPELIFRNISKQIVQIYKDYMAFVVGAEIADDINKKVLPYIPQEILSIEDLEECSKKASEAGFGIDHPFCVLYSLGLLGHVEPHLTGRGLQQFEFYIAGPLRRRLPQGADHYLVHPVLQAMLAQGSNVAATLKPAPVKYRPLARKLIGNGLPWHDPTAENRFIVELDASAKGASRVLLNGVEIIGPIAARETAKQRQATDKLVSKAGNGRSKSQLRAASLAAAAHRVARYGNLPHMFTLAWLVALASKHSRAIFVDDVSLCVDLLVKLRVFPPRIARPKQTAETFGKQPSSKAKNPSDSMPTKERFESLLEGIDNSHYVIADVRKYLELLELSEPIRIVDSEANSANRQVHSSSVVAVNVSISGEESLLEAINLTFNPTPRRSS